MGGVATHSFVSRAKYVCSQWSRAEALLQCSQAFKWRSNLLTPALAVTTASMGVLTVSACMSIESPVSAASETIW